jgi:hypothetical protein
MQLTPFAEHMRHALSTLTDEYEVHEEQIGLCHFKLIITTPGLAVPPEVKQTIRAAASNMLPAVYKYAFEFRS